MHSEFEAGDVLGGSDVAGNTCDEQIAEALVKDNFNGNAGVRATEKSRKRRLARGYLPKPHDVAVWSDALTGDEALVAGVQQVDRFLRI